MYSKAYLNQYFKVFQLLKCDGNIVTTYRIFKHKLWWKCELLQIAPYDA